MNAQKLAFFLAALGTLMLSMACGPASEVVLPGGFVALTDDQIEWKDYDWKAVSPDGAAIVLRERDNEQEGTLDFWSEALEREILESQGYKLLDKGPVSAQNLRGTLMNFEALYGGKKHFYSVALFVTDDLIITVETGASEPVYERHQEALQQALRSVKL